MKLQAYILNGKPLTEYPSWSSGDVNGKEFIVNDIIQTNYQDVTSITNWDSYGLKLKDFNYVRERIKELTISIGFNNLTLDEKIISAKYFIVDKPDRDTVLNEIEQYDYWSILITQSQMARFIRWEHAKKYISYKLTPINSSDLAKSTFSLVSVLASCEVSLRIFRGGTPH